MFKHCVDSGRERFVLFCSAIDQSACWVAFRISRNASIIVPPPALLCLVNTGSNGGFGSLSFWQRKVLRARGRLGS